MANSGFDRSFPHLVRPTTPSTIRQSTTALAVIWCFVSAAGAADSPRPKLVSHVDRIVEGWTIRVDQRLLEGDDATLGHHAMQLIASRLADVKLALGAEKIERLQKVTIWLDRTHGELRAAQYHPSAGWLKANDYDERLEKCVHIPDATDFVSRGHQRIQP